MELSIERTNRVPRRGKAGTLLRALLCVPLFALFLKLDALLQLGSALFERGWSMPAILAALVVFRMVLAGAVTLALLPWVLGLKRLRERLPGLLRVDRKGLLAGALSFGIFCALAAAIALAMGIWAGDPSAVFARPEVRPGPEPDVVGWGYFLLALVPGIWEELAFRGLILSRLRARFSVAASVMLSAVLFALFHVSNLVTQAPGQVIGGTIMALLFGIAWGVLTVRAGSIIPAMLAHYLVDSLGQIFLGVDASDPALSTGFFLLLTLAFPLANLLAVRALYRKRAVRT